MGIKRPGVSTGDALASCLLPALALQFNSWRYSFAVAGLAAVGSALLVFSEGFRPSRLKISVKIRAYQEVTVPAGTFKTLRIQAGQETFWYAPSIGWAVKEEIEPYGKAGWLFELVKYTIPQR